MIGQRIAYFRTQRRLSQNAVAKAVGIQQTLISRIEHGKRKVTAEEIPKFAEVFQVDVRQLLEVPELHRCAFCDEPLDDHACSGLCRRCTEIHYD